jgi:arylsulfatase A-like enzyme
MGRYATLNLPVRSPSRAERERSISDKWPGYLPRQLEGNPHFESKAWLAQLRMLRNADDIVGRVMHQLSVQHESANTLVVFLSDNGYLFGAHRMYGKRLPYTESIKVPAFIRWPHHIVGGSIDRRLSANVDLMPTILNAARVTPALVYPMDGRDLFDPSWDRRFMLTAHWHENTRKANPWTPTWASVRSTMEHYIEYLSRQRHLPGALQPSHRPCRAQQHARWAAGRAAFHVPARPDCAGTHLRWAGLPVMRGGAT